nr:cytochrome P450 CYP72A567 [Psammosilene tunicoides]
MKEYIPYVATGIACIVILRWVLNMLKWLWIEPRRLEKCLRKQGLEGNSYKFLFGDMKEASKLRTEALAKPMPMRFNHDYFPRINPFVDQLLNKYGTNCFMWMGPVPTVHIGEPELVREAFNRMHEFQKPKTNPLSALLATGLVSYEGDKWAKHRRLINPAFHVEKLKLMIPAFRESIVEVVKEWEKRVPESGSAEIDVWPYLTSLTGDVISRAAFGSVYGDGKRIFELLSVQKELVLSLLKYSYIPGYTYLPTEGNKKMKEVNNEIQRLLENVIQNRKKAMEAGEAAKDDLLGLLMDSNYKESLLEGGGKNKKLIMSFQDLIDECKLFFLAGHETTAVLLAWTMILLSKHQDWQTRAREEVLATFGMREPTDYDALNRLKTVTMILNEVLRLYPPVISTNRKLFNGEAKIGNLIIPSGVGISLLTVQANRDPKVWGEDASEFRPDRFAEGLVKATKGNVAFFPFGWGPRICIGQNFALTESKMAVAMILQRFTFDFSPTYTHAPSGLITLNPQYGAPLMFRKR